MLFYSHSKITYLYTVDTEKQTTTTKNVEFIESLTKSIVIQLLKKSMNTCNKNRGARICEYMQIYLRVNVQSDANAFMFQSLFRL